MTSAAPAKKPYRKAPPEHRELRLEVPGSRLEQEEPLTDAERMKLLEQENEELRRRLASATRRTEALERELEIGQDCLELELGQSREELDKFKDKFRRLQNSYTASQRTNQELEDKLHALIKKAEMDRKTLDWEIVELTNKLLDAKNTINRLEELNVRASRGPASPVAGSVLGRPLPWPGLGSEPRCICRSGTGWTATWLYSCSSATSPTSATTSWLT